MRRPEDLKAEAHAAGAAKARRLSVIPGLSSDWRATGYGYPALVKSQGSSLLPPPPPPRAAPQTNRHKPDRPEIRTKPPPQTELLGDTTKRPPPAKGRHAIFCRASV